MVLGDVEEQFGDCGLVVGVCLGGGGGGGDEGEDGGGYEGEFVALLGVSICSVCVKEGSLEREFGPAYLKVVVS